MKIKNLFAFCLMSAFLLNTHNANAISKLDFSAPIADVNDKVGKVKMKIENVYNTQLEKLNAKIHKVTGREGSMVFNYLRKNGAAIVTSAAKGQFYAADYTGSGLLNAIKSELGNYKLDYATLYNQAERYVQSREQEKIQKIASMEKEMLKLEAEKEALNKRFIAKNPNQPLSEAEISRLKELEETIPQIQKAIAWEQERNVKEDAEYKKLQQQLSAQQNIINSLTAKTSEEEVVNLLGKQTLKLFGTSGKDEENEELYTMAQDKFFLKKNEPENPDNMERVRKIRKQEYYKALKNSMETVVTTYSSVEEIKERSVNCTDAATKMAQGIFGAMAMRVCVELQNAKVAARYMEILLAQIRLETTRDMQFWNDKYKLEDYDKDMTTFNLDDYKMQKQTLFKKLQAKAQSAIKSKVQDKISDFTNVYSGF